MMGESADTVPGLSPRRCPGCRSLLTRARADYDACLADMRAAVEEVTP